VLVGLWAPGIFWPRFFFLLTRDPFPGFHSSQYPPAALKSGFPPPPLPRATKMVSFFIGFLLPEFPKFRWAGSRWAHGFCEWPPPWLDRTGRVFFGLQKKKKLPRFDGVQRQYVSSFFCGSAWSSDWRSDSPFWAIFRVTVGGLWTIPSHCRDIYPSLKRQRGSRSMLVRDGSHVLELIQDFLESRISPPRCFSTRLSMGPFVLVA